MTATSGAGITNGASAEEYVERIDVGASVNGPPARGGRWAVTGGIERRRRSKGYQALPSTDPAATETARDHMASAVRYHVFLSRVQQAGKPLSPPPSPAPIRADALSCERDPRDDQHIRHVGPEDESLRVALRPTEASGPRSREADSEQHEPRDLCYIRGMRPVNGRQAVTTGRDEKRERTGGPDGLGM